MLFTEKKEIEDWLKEYGIENYELIPDEKYGHMVNVNGNIRLNNYKLKRIDVKFNKIFGNFDCSINELNSLEGCPKVVDGYFNCSNNKLETLEGCPGIVLTDFSCSFNQLNSLKYGPKIVRNYYCNNNKLISLIYCAEDLKNLYCDFNKLKTLEGCPEIINGSFYCSHNYLTSLKGCAKIINGNFVCNHNKLKSLEGSPKIIEECFYCDGNDLNIKGLKYLPKEIESNYISINNNNIEIKELELITDFKNLKKRINIILEKENLLNNINKDYLKNNNVVNKI